MRRLRSFLARARLAWPRGGAVVGAWRRRAALHPDIERALATRAPLLEPYARLACGWDEHAARSAPRYGPFARWLVVDGGVGRGRAVDLACGTGITTRALAATFAEVLAVDRSEAMLEEARRRLAGLGNVRLLRSDLREWSADAASVDLVTCSGDSLNYLGSPAELARVLAAVAAALRPGGRFVFDLQSERSFRGDRGVFHYRHGGVEWYQVPAYDPATRVDDACAVTRDGVELHRRILLSRDDVARAAGAAGLAFAERFDGALLRGMSPHRDFYSLRRADDRRPVPG